MRVYTRDLTPPFQATVSVNNCRVPAPHTFTTWEAADEWCRSQQRALDSGVWTDPREGAIRLRYYALEEWLPRKRIAPRTRDNYQRWFEQHILTEPTLDVPLNRLSSPAIERWFVALSEKHPPTAAKVARALNNCLSTAVQDGLIAANPLRLQKGWYQEEVNENRPFASPHDVERLVAVLPPWWKALVYLASYGGLRFGELYGLRVEDIELEHGRVRVRRAWVEPERGDGFLGPLQSRSSQRTIVLPAPIVPAIAEHIGRYVGPPNAGFLFRGPSGAVPKRGNFHTTWSRGRAKAGLPEAFHFHDLRGSGATWLAQNGATLRELMDWLGHSNPRMAE